MRRTTVTLPDDLAVLLEREARHRETSVSAVVRELVAERFLGTTDRPRSIPWAGLVDDPSMVPGEKLEQALADGWADAIDRDRG